MSLCVQNYTCILREHPIYANNRSRQKERNGKALSLRKCGRAQQEISPKVLLLDDESTFNCVVIVRRKTNGKEELGENIDTKLKQDGSIQQQ